MGGGGRNFAGQDHTGSVRRVPRAHGGARHHATGADRRATAERGAHLPPAEPGCPLANGGGVARMPLAEADGERRGRRRQILPGRTTPVQSAGRRARTAGPAGTQRRPTVAADSRPPPAEPGCPLTNGGGVGGGRRFLAGQDHTSHFNVLCFRRGVPRAHGGSRHHAPGADRRRRRPHGRAGVPTGQRGRRGRLGHRAGPHRFSPQGAARARQHRRPTVAADSRPPLASRGVHCPTGAAWERAGF